MTVRHAQTGDMPTIIELLEQELGYPQERLVQTNARLQRILSHPDYSTFVALNESTVVGFIGLMRSVSPMNSREIICELPQSPSGKRSKAAAWAAYCYSMRNASPERLVFPALRSTVGFPGCLPTLFMKSRAL